MANIRPTVVVIGGAQRSGTTLMQTLLENALPKATQLPECQFLYDLFESYGKRIREPHKLEGFFDELQRSRVLTGIAILRSQVCPHKG